MTGVRRARTRIPDVTEAVGTWLVPGKDGGEHVMVDLESAWAVNAQASDVEMAKKVLLELGSVKADVAYASRIGNIPGRRDAGDDPDFKKLDALVPILAGAEKGTFIKTAPGFSAVSEGVARATDALLRKETDAAGAQKILVDYVRETLGDDMVK